MGYEAVLWVQAVHVFGFVMWVGTLMGLYQTIFTIDSTRDDAGKKALIELGRRIAAAMDIGALLALGSGVGLLFGITPSPLANGWMYVKLVTLALFLASHVYGRVTLGNIRKGGANVLPPVFFALLNVFLVTIIIMAVIRPF